MEMAESERARHRDGDGGGVNREVDRRKWWREGKKKDRRFLK
jgi:hypothetical protein